MLTTLTLSAALFAPAAPVPATPSGPPPGIGAVPAGPPPRVLDLRPDADGKVRVQVVRQINPPVVAPAPVPRPAAVGGVRRVQRVELADLTDLKAMTAGGKEIPKDDVLKMLANGGVVIVPADGKAVPPGYLKMFKDDAVILTSPDLAGGPTAPLGGGFAPAAGGNALPRNAPAAPGGAAPGLVPSTVPVAPPAPKG